MIDGLTDELAAELLTPTARRILRIERVLQERGTVPFAALRRHLGVSPATLKRDLLFMRERLNAPVTYDRNKNGYRLGAPWSLLPFPITITESTR
jgi:predicted DNA-binding transcriptional regulator YafY